MKITNLEDDNIEFYFYFEESEVQYQQKYRVTLWKTWTQPKT